MRVYLDYNATAPVRPQVREAIEPLLFGSVQDGLHGNASSVHWAGQAARRVLEGARTELSERLDCKPSELIFTSGGSESDNLALRGVMLHPSNAGKRLLISSVEHPAVLEAAHLLRADGIEVVELPVDPQGALKLQALERALQGGAALVSVMTVNNETGVCMPIDEVVELSHAHGALVHTDAVQALGRLPALPKADLVTFSGHKLGGLKGAGALIVRGDVPLRAEIVGGPQERGKRAGTENVPAIVAMNIAAGIALDQQAAEHKRLGALQARLDALLNEQKGTRVIGASSERVFNTSTAIFDDVDGEALLQALDLEGIAVSSGSACSSGSLEPSHVLEAMDVPAEKALSAVRFSTGWATTPEEIQHLEALLPSVLAQVRGD